MSRRNVQPNDLQQVIAHSQRLGLLSGESLKKWSPPVFFLYYLPYKDRVESARLERRYGLAFACYREAVPALLPSMTRWSPPPDLSGTASRRWSRRRFRENGELANLAGVGLALGLFALRLTLSS